jgi:hypothetical protein
MDSLHLKPWQEPPCWAGDDKPVDRDGTHGRAAAWALRRKLIKAGLSMYEPDPVAALEAVAACQRDDARAHSPRSRDSRDEQAPASPHTPEESEEATPELGDPLLEARY